MEAFNTYQESVLIDNDYFISLINDLNLAKKSIDMETYIFTEDKIGETIVCALIRAAKRGVLVRLLVDGIGTSKWKELQKKMETNNLLVRAYHPLFWTILQKPFNYKFIKNLLHFISHVNSRNHRKTCVIDEKIMYIGSANITEYSRIKDKNLKWHDITIRVIGLKYVELLLAFNAAWHCTMFGYHLYYQIKRMSEDPILRLNYSRKKKRYYYKMLLAKIETATVHINIMSAYFVPRRFLLLKLAKAARRGVKVTIIVPKHPDVIGISLLASSFYYKLLRAGVTILHHTDGVLHTKFLMIDDWFCVGSSNLNYRSLQHDLEADMVIQLDESKNKLEKLFKQYCNQSEKISFADIKNKSWYEKIMIKFIWVFRFWF